MSFLCLECPLPDCNDQSPRCLVQIERRERNKESVKRYVARNPEKRRETQRKRREQNKAAINAYKREWRKRRNESIKNTAADTESRVRRVAAYIDGNDSDTALARVEVI